MVDWGEGTDGAADVRVAVDVVAAAAVAGGVAAVEPFGDDYRVAGD